MNTILIDKEEWEIVPETSEEIDGYEYKDYHKSIPIYKNKFMFDSIDRYIKSEMKTNIHFIFSRISAKDCCRLIKGDDIFDNKINLNKLNAVVFLLFKPQGKAKNLDWAPSNDQIREFAEAIKKPECGMKIGMDSCLVNEVAKVRDLTPAEELFADTCEGARMSCYITPDMRLVPCSFGCHDTHGVDIKNQDIQFVWQESTPFVNFRDVLKEHPNCCPFDVRGF